MTKENAVKEFQRLYCNLVNYCTNKNVINESWRLYLNSLVQVDHITTTQAIEWRTLC